MDIALSDAWQAEYDRAETTYATAWDRLRRDQRAHGGAGHAERDLLRRAVAARDRVRFLARLGQMTPAQRAQHLG